MEVPSLLELRTGVEGVVLESVKLLRFDAPVQTFGLWKPPTPPTTTEILQKLRLPKVPQEDAQCQATIQIDPLSDLVKKHVTDSVRTDMSFVEVVDVREEDYLERSKPEIPRKGIDKGRFTTKAEFGGVGGKKEDPMEHYKDTWQFQQTYLQSRLQSCTSAASSLLQDLSSAASDFQSLHTHPLSKAKQDEKSRLLLEQQETAQRTKVADDLLAKNRELISEADKLLSKAVISERKNSLPVNDQPEKPQNTLKYNSSEVLTKRITTAFETATKAVNISQRGKGLERPKRKLYDSRKR